MSQALLNMLRTEPRRSIIYLASLTLIRAGIQIALYKHGFISVAADEFARGLRAAQWAENPRIDVLADVQDVWLPFEKYLNGLFLFVWPDVILAPRFTVFLASCLLLVVIYVLAYYLFKRFTIAALSTLLITVHPWYVWLSGTPMMEMYYFACFFAGLLLLIAWLEEARRGYWFWAGICFILASGFHVQSWTYINLINLLTLPFLYRFLRQRNYASLARLIAYYVLSNGLVLSFLLIEYRYTGEILAFLENHTSYSKWFYEGYEVSIREKFLYYPRLVIQNSSTIFWICLLAAFAFLSRERERFWKLFPLLLAMLALLLNSVMNILSGPPSAAPGRYSLFHIIVLSLYVGYGTYHLFHWAWRHSRWIVRYPLLSISIALFLYGMWWGASRIRYYPQAMPADSVEVGRQLHTLLDENPGLYMVELHYWDFLAVNLTSHHYDKIIYDRELDLLNRDIPSVFTKDTKLLCSRLTVPNLRYVVLKNEELKAEAQQINLLRSRQDVGRWTIYEVVPQSEGASEQCHSSRN